MNHGDAPRPDSPSRGLVVATAAETNDSSRGGTTGFLSWFGGGSGTTGAGGTSTTSSASSLKPLRLLVIGDSLAAGVGVSQSSAPVLPEAIAQSLSQAQQGRAVYWTCIGTPGYSATQILNEIYDLQDPPNTLIHKLEEWQREQRKAAQQRISTTRRKAESWWQRRRLEDDDDDQASTEDTTKGNGPLPMIGRWWQRTTKQIQKDWNGLRSIFQADTITSGEDDDDDYAYARSKAHSDEDDEDNTKRYELAKRRPTKRKLIRKDSMLHPAVVGDYDVAIVLTGVNDLKDAFLPFMMSRQKKEELAAARKEHDADGGLRGNLILLVDALRSRMIDGRNTSEDGSDMRGESGRTDANSNQTTSLSSSDNEDLGPLMVFPAMPTAPISLSQVIPLCWFLVPLIRSMDRNKQMLGELYPELVLFVKAPSAEVFSQAEEQKGPLWEGLDQEHVWLRLTDIAQQAGERVEKMMRTHYESWVMDAQDEEGQYMLTEDAVIFLTEVEFVSGRKALALAVGKLQ